MPDINEQHEILAKKTFQRAAKERGLNFPDDDLKITEITKDDMPKRPPDYFVTLPSGQRMGVWEEPQE